MVVSESTEYREWSWAVSGSTDSREWLWSFLNSLNVENGRGSL